MDIRNDRQKGLSYVELGKKYHMDPRTAKRYAESPQKPEYILSAPKPAKMDLDEKATVWFETMSGKQGQDAGAEPEPEGGFIAADEQELEE